MFDAIGSIFSIGEKIVDRIWPDPEEKRQAMLRLSELKQQGDLAFLDADVRLMTGQMEINKMEAMHGGWFKGGWRPAVGWICVFALAYKFLILPFMLFVAQMYSHQTNEELFPIEFLPELAWGELSVILLGMLGIGAQRSLEKMRTVK